MNGFFKNGKSLTRLEKFHSHINAKYLPERKIELAIVKNLSQDFWAMAFKKEEKIAYKIDCVRDLYSVCIHEFAHQIQFRHFDYSEHNLEFCLIVNIITLIEHGQKHVFIKQYDIKEDLIAQNVSMSFRLFAAVVLYLAPLPFAEAVRRVPRWANHLRGGLDPRADIGDPCELPTAGEIRQAFY